MFLYKYRHKQGMTSTGAVLFICILLMLIILLPWIHPVTDQHPTCIATSISHCFMATALIPYSRVTHAVFVVVEVNGLLKQNKKCAGIRFLMAEVQVQSFAEEHKVMTEQKCLFRNLGCLRDCCILEATVVQKLTDTGFTSETRM